jgi:hypothetical protein
MTTWHLATVFVGLFLSVSLEGNPIGKDCFVSGDGCNDPLPEFVPIGTRNSQC